MNPLDEQFLQMLRAAFAEEAQEHVQEAANRLLELEAALDAAGQAAPLEALHRVVHSLKGASRAVGSGAIESICQCLETLFSKWQKGEFHPTPNAYDVLHKANTAIGEITLDLQAAEQGAFPVTAVLDSIKTLLQETPDEAQIFVVHTDQPGGATPPSTIPPPVTLPLPDVAPPVELPVQETIPSPPPAPAIPPTVPEIRQPAVNGNGQGNNGRHGAAPRPTAEPAPEPAIRAASSDETIRIAASRLDNLLLQAEELLVVKQSAAARANALRAITESFRVWQEEWAKAGRALRLEEGLTPNESMTPEQRTLREFFAWNRGHQRELEDQLQDVTRTAEQDRRSFGGLIDNLLDQTKELLTLPFGHVLNSLPVLVRDLSRQLGKEVRLDISGEDTFLDKRILEEIKDPLLHLVRNALDHGIESPAVRRQRGKPEAATLKVRASQSGGNEVTIEIRDDGGGLNLEALVAAAVARGTYSPEEAERLSLEEKQNLIFQSSLSTSATVTTISGRGLGMAIVREKVEKLGGRVTLDSTPGQGTAFQLHLPVTLATFRGVVVESRGRTFVVPIAGVERVLRVKRSNLRRVANRETILMPGKNGSEVLPLIQLHQALRLPAGERPALETLPVMVLRQGEQRVAFAVDDIRHEQEVLVKPLPRPLTRVHFVAGTTVLEDGRAVPILSPTDLLSGTENFSAITDMAPSLPEDEIQGPRVATPAAQRTVLIAEDSVTSRMLVKNILETAGFKVITAVDGADALEQLHRNHVDLVVSDVDMPRLDGFALTAQIRQHPATSAVPVVLVTSRDTDEDKTRGMEAGANAYIVKSSFDQLDLLQVVKRLI